MQELNKLEIVQKRKFFNRAVSSLNKLLYKPSQRGLHGMYIYLKRKDLIKAYIANNKVVENEEEKVLPLLEPISDDELSHLNEEPQTSTEEKLRVVEIMPITDNLKEKDEQDFMVSDFKDDDYVDINSVMPTVGDE